MNDPKAILKSLVKLCILVTAHSRESVCVGDKEKNDENVIIFEQVVQFSTRI